MADKMADMADSKVGDMATRERKRRQYGTGSVYQRSDGRWAGVIDAGYTESGARKRITRTGKTEAEVKAKLKTLLRERADAKTVAPNARTTVKKWADEWLGLVERDQRPTTFNATKVAVNKWIVPTIGHERLSELAPAHARAVAKAQRAKGRSSSTQLRTHSVLVKMLKDAAQDGYPVPASIIAAKRPVKAVSDRDAMTLPHALAVLAQAAASPDKARWVAALLQAMRQGEALGLTWPAVDLGRGVLTISWQLQPLPYRIKRDRSSGFRVPDGYEARQVKGALHLVRPKSKKGWRVIPLVPWMASALTDWQRVAPTSAHKLVWPTPDGAPRLARDDDAAWYALQDAAGVEHPSGRPYTIHEARHTTATLLLEAKVDPAVIMTIMGHSDIVTTRGYQHASTEMALEALNKVAARLELG